MKTIIIDDERLARRELRGLLKQFEEIEIVEEAGNAEEAKAAIEKYRPDLIFLDIQMPDQSGFELLSELDFVPQVIFVTAFDEYALDAFKVNALDYLLKPVEEDRLEEALKKVKTEYEEIKTEVATASHSLKGEDKIFIKDGEKCWFVALNTIRMFESEGNYVRVYFENFKPLILRSLNNLETRLDPQLFFRANRKFLINLQWVDHIENWFNGGLRVTLSDGTQIEVSRRQASKFKDLKSL